MQEAYCNHHVYVLCSSHELAAISHIEAMSNGLPVIVTSENGTNYVVEYGVNGFIFDPSRENSMLNEVMKFIHYPDLVMDMGKRAKETVNNNFTQYKFRKNIEKIFDRMKI